MQLKATVVLYHVQKNQTGGRWGGWFKKKNARWLLCFLAKSNTEKFDKADTAQSENFIHSSAIFYSNTPVRSVYKVWESSWDLQC